MRIEGILTKWNDDRGFGFITPIQGGSEVFVHISAFPKGGCRPMIGERFIFEIETDNTGKKQAKNLLYPGRSTVRSTRQPMPHCRTGKQGFFGRAISLVAIVVALVFYGYSEYSRPLAPQAVITDQPDDQAASSTFQCDGRTHCAQMTSCAEARFFLRNCQNVEMDGNHDGVPCEQQWCTNPFAK